MNVIDTHCDALLKLQGDYRDSLRTGKRLLDYRNSDKLDSNAARLEKGDVKVQFFAIFIAPNIPDNEKWQHALEQVDRSEEHTSELQSRFDLVCRLLLEKKKRKKERHRWK